MECFRIALVVILLICVAPRRSGGSSLDNFRFPAQIGRKSEGINQMSPSPSPWPDGNFDSGKAPSPHVNGKKEENCDTVVNKCKILAYNITACVPFSGNELDYDLSGYQAGSEAAYLFIPNTGSSFRELNGNVQLQPGNITKQIIIVSGQHLEVNLTSKMEGNSSITLTIGENSCVIQIGASAPEGFNNYVTPKYGAYLLFVAAVFAGVSWACCKLVQRKHRLEGVPYQELEMGQQDTDPSFVIESPEGWDENWDDDWDEEKAVRSPGARKGLQNGASLKYIDTSQWGNDWDD